jgi:hypothetical protein
MTPNDDNNLLQTALTLPPNLRTQLAQTLLESLDRPPSRKRYHLRDLAEQRSLRDEWWIPARHQRRHRPAAK